MRLSIAACTSDSDRLITGSRAVSWLQPVVMALIDSG